MIELVAELNISDDLNADLNINRDLNADLGDILPAGVTSWNGEVGDVVYTPPITSVNGQTGDVTVNELKPIIAWLSDVTPAQVLAKLEAGQTIWLSSMTAYGLVTFNFFGYVNASNLLFANTMIFVGYPVTAYSVTINGDVQTGTWETTYIPMAKSSDIPAVHDYSLSKIGANCIGELASFTVTDPTITVTPSTTSVPNVTNAGSADTWAFTYNSATEELVISGANGTAPTLGTAISVVDGITSASASGTGVAWDSKDTKQVLAYSTELVG